MRRLFESHAFRLAGGWLGCGASIGCCIVIIISVLALVNEGRGVDDVKRRASTMDSAEDFVSIVGGCTIVAANASLHSYSYYRAASDSCYSQCRSTSAAACSKRITFTFVIDGDMSVRYASAPEDTLLREAETCESCGEPCLSQEADWLSSADARVGETVPCWRSRHSDITRDDVPSADPRWASYAGISECSSSCFSFLGYRCGNAECIKLSDPAGEVAYLQAYAPPSLPRHIGLVAGCSAALLLLGVLAIVIQKGCDCDNDGDGSDGDDDGGGGDDGGDGSKEAATPKKGGVCDDDWGDMTEEQRQAARVLGYNKKAWNKDKKVPADDKGWDELTPEERQAASLLGYTKQLWDVEDELEA